MTTTRHELDTATVFSMQVIIVTVDAVPHAFHDARALRDTAYECEDNGDSTRAAVLLSAAKHADSGRTEHVDIGWSMHVATVHCVR